MRLFHILLYFYLLSYKNVVYLQPIMKYKIFKYDF